MGSEEVESILQVSCYLKGVHVLLVDYDQNSLSKSTLVLRKASLKVTPTKIQQVALTIIQEFKGQYGMLIISDQTQEMDFFSFVQRIKCIQEDILIIVVSSMEINTDQGLKTLYDETCYLVNKPIDENVIRNVWKRHQMRTNLNLTREDHKRKDKKVIGDVAMYPSFMGGSSFKQMLDELVGKEHEMQVGLKRSQPFDDDEVAKKKGKRVLEETKPDGFEVTKKKPMFDPEQHKKLMEAIAYDGPTKPISISDFLPKEKGFALALQEVPGLAKTYVREKRLKEAFSTTPRAPWTQNLYRKFVQTIFLREIQGGCLGMGGYGYGYGAPQRHRYQMPYQRLPPTWMSTQDWKAQMSSEFLSMATNAGTNNFPQFGLSDQNISKGLSMVGSQMHMNVNMGNVKMCNDVMLGMKGVRGNGMELGTESNPIVVDEGSTSNALASNHHDTHLNEGTSIGYFGYSHSSHPPTAEVHNNNNEVTNNYSLQTEGGQMMNELIDYGQNLGSHELLNTEFASLDFISLLQNTTALSTRTDDLPMTGFNTEFAPPYNSVNDKSLDLLEVYRQQLTSAGANEQLELQNASNYQIPNLGLFDDSLQVILQGSCGIESAGSLVNQWPNLMPKWLDSPINNFVNPEYVNEQNADLNVVLLDAIENQGETSGNGNYDPNAAFLAETTNQVETFANEMNNQASQEGENIILNFQENDFDFAELFAYLDTSNEGTSLGPDQVQEANSNNGIAEMDYQSYFDIDSFDLYSALNN